MHIPLNQELPINFCVIIFDIILHSDKQNYMELLDSNMQGLSFKFNLHLLLLLLVVCVLLCHKV